MALELGSGEELAELRELRFTGNPVAIEAPPLVRIRTPRALMALDSVHRASRTALTSLADFAFITLCSIAARIPVVEAASFSLAVVAFLVASGRYAERSPLETQGILWFAPQIVMPIAVVSLSAVAIAHRLGDPQSPPLLFAPIALASLLALRVITWSVLAQARRKGVGLRRTLIVGDGPRSMIVREKLLAYPDAGLKPVASLCFEGPCGSEAEAFESATRLARTIDENEIDEVVLAPEDGSDLILDCVRATEGLNANFSLLPPLADLFLHPGLVTQVGGLPLIQLGRIARKRASLPGKRMFDVFIASVLMFLFSPVFLLVALAIKVSDRGPVLYKQGRVGRDGHIFRMLKFRSMVSSAEHLVIDLSSKNVTNGLLFKVLDDPRVTRVGRVIRKLSLDELPQLLNVLRGEMSLVGPRPLAVEPDAFGQVGQKRHSVAPGITGYWQISGGNGLTYEEMIKLDLAYINNWSLWLDIRLLLRTIPIVFYRRDPW